MLGLISLFTVLIILILVNRWNNRKIIKLSKQLKSETPCLPIIGHAHKFIGNEEVHMKFFQHFGREAIKLGGLTSFWLGNMLFVSIADPVDTEFILKNYLEKGFVMNFGRDVIGNGNLVAPVSIWRLRRKVLVRTFSPKNLQQFSNILSRQSIDMVDKLATKLSIGLFPIWNHFNSFAMNSICETTLGSDLDTTLKNQFLETIERGFKNVCDRMVSPWKFNGTLYKLFPSYYISQEFKRYIKDYYGKVIKSKRKELLAKSNTTDENTNKITTKRVKSFLELMMEAKVNGKSYTDEELQEETVVLFAAGSDTSAIGASFTTCLLARHPDVQEKLYAELKKEYGDSARPVSLADLPRLKYLDAVLKESIRLYPPVPLIIRQADRELTLPSGVTIVPNCELMVNIWAIHRNPKYWGPDAEVFRPERWLDKDSTLKHPVQFMPFSYGPRNCAGYQYAMFTMKTVMATMLRQYKILPDTELTREGTHKPFRLKMAITMKETDNFQVALERRC